MSANDSAVPQWANAAAREYSSLQGAVAPDDILQLAAIIAAHAPASVDGELSCPFCKESGFDEVGLKIHLVASVCEKYAAVSTDLPRTVNAKLRGQG